MKNETEFFKRDVNLVKELVKHHDALNKQYEDLHKLTRCDVDSPLFNAVWKAYDSYINVVSALIGDTQRNDWDSWVSWYIYDNNCGRSGLPAGVSGNKMKPIRTVEDLVRLIHAKAEENKRV